MMIKDFIDERPMVTLFTRPRRFGKTLNMDMLRTYFEKSDKDTSVYFRDKKNTPEVKLGQYKGLAVTRHVRPVTDKTVDIELVHQARMHAVYHPTTEPAKRGFRALLDFAGYMDGKEIPATSD